MAIIPFGTLAEDRITGFKGFVVSCMEHMNECVRYGIQPPMDKEGQLPEAKAIDGPDLVIIAPPKDDLPPAIKTPNAFKLGVKVRDRLTGFAGIAVVRMKHMYSGDRYAVQSRVNKKGEIPDLKSFDEKDLEQIDPPPRKKKKKAEKKNPEGPHDHSVFMGR